MSHVHTFTDAGGVQRLAAYPSDCDQCRRAVPTGPPAGKTTFGATVWAGPPEGRVLAWGGPSDYVHLHASVTAGKRFLYLGAAQRTVSARCATLAEAQAAVDAFLFAAYAPLERDHMESD
jgi:hypothetical protein